MTIKGIQTVQDLTSAVSPFRNGRGCSPTALGRPSMKQLALSEFSSTVPECPTCGRDDFKSDRGMRMHHSREHGESLTTVTIKCDWCGDTAEKYPSRSGYDQEFCDKDCHAKWKAEKPIEEHPRYKGGLTMNECEQCGLAFEVNRYRKKTAQFCSRQCHGRWKTDVGTVEVECEWCGQSVTKWNREYESKDHHYCSSTCYGQWTSKHRSGQDHPNWRGGTSVYVAVRELLGDQPWDAIAGRHRGDRCEWCGGGGEGLHVHHIIPVMCGGTNEPWNLMTLCPSCHRTTEIYTGQLLDRALEVPE